MKKVKVWELDVWGNENEGFEMNDRFKIMETEVADNFFEISDKEIIKWLKSMDLIKKGVHTKSILLSGDGETYLYVDEAKNSYPLYQIELD